MLGNANKVNGAGDSTSPAPFVRGDNMIAPINIVPPWLDRPITILPVPSPGSPPSPPWSQNPWPQGLTDAYTFATVCV